MSDTCALTCAAQVRADTLLGVAVAANARSCREPPSSAAPPGRGGATKVKFRPSTRWWDFQVSATYQNIPGIPLTASRVYTNAEIRPSSAGIWV